MSTDYSRRRISAAGSFWSTVVIFIVALLLIGICYSWSYNSIADSCEERGGHMEPIIGGRGSVCEGAER